MVYQTLEKACKLLVHPFPFCLQSHKINNYYSANLAVKQYSRLLCLHLFWELDGFVTAINQQGYHRWGYLLLVLWGLPYFFHKMHIWRITISSPGLSFRCSYMPPHIQIYRFKFKAITSWSIPLTFGRVSSSVVLLVFPGCHFS